MRTGGYWGHVLIVDDNPRLLRSLSFLMYVAGYRVTAAATVDDALLSLGRDCPDYVLADADMPGANGLDLLRVMHGYPAWSTIPVIITSPSDEHTDLMHALDLGAADFLPKPFELRDVLETFERLNAERLPTRKAG